MAITLKAARINAGLTQSDAGKLLGVTADVVSNWETHRTYPDARHIAAIEKVYGLHYDDIIFLPKEYALSVEV